MGLRERSVALGVMAVGAYHDCCRVGCGGALEVATKGAAIGSLQYGWASKEKD